MRAVDALQDKSITHDELVAQIEQWCNKTDIFVTTKTIKYMVKSGRLNAMKGFIGKLLRVKPIVTVNNKGIPELFGKPLTEKSSRKMVVRTIEKKIKSRKLWGGYSITHANNPSTADWYAREIEKL